MNMNKAKWNILAAIVVVVVLAFMLATSGCIEEEQQTARMTISATDPMETLPPLTPPVWGQGELPADFLRMFGPDNPNNHPRLDYAQNQVLEKHSKILVEIAKRILGLEYVDPNAVPAETRAKVLDTEWCGHPSVANPDGYHMNEGYLIDFYIGFRSDGVVVWRYTDPNEVAK